MTITVICENHRKPYTVTRYARSAGAAGAVVGVSLSGRDAAAGEWLEVWPPEVARYRRARQAAEDDLSARAQAGETVTAVDRFRARPPRSDERSPGAERVSNRDGADWLPAPTDPEALAEALTAGLSSSVHVTCANRCPACDDNVPRRGENMIPLLDQLEPLGVLEVSLEQLRNLAARHDRGRNSEE